MPAPKSFPLTVTGPDVAFVGAAYTNGASQPEWLGIDLKGSGSNYTLGLSIRSTFIAPGTYTSTFSVGTADRAGNVLQSQSLKVTYTVVGSLSLAGGTVYRSYILGDGLQSENLQVEVRGESQDWTVSSSAPWIQVPSTAFHGAQTFTAILDPRSLPVGSHQATLKVTNTADSSDTAELSVNVVVTAPPPVRFVTPSASRSYTFGAGLIAEELAVRVDAQSQEWTLTTSAAWLQVPSGTFRDSQTFIATLDPRNLPVGSHRAVLTATSQADRANTATFEVEAVVAAPSLTISQDDLIFGGADGLAPLEAKPFSFALTTGAGTHPYTLTARTDVGQGWLVLDRTSGSLGGAGSTAQVSIDPTGLRGGTYTGSVTIAANVLGMEFTETRTVVLNLEANRLVPSALGVAFTKLSDRSVLSRQVSVFGTGRRTDMPWSATSDRAWLTVTASGTAGGTLELKADPAGLPAESTQFATVTLSSSDASVENQPTIRVGLYVSAQSASAVDLTSMAGFLATSPVEPLVALSNGSSTTVELINVFTGASAGSILSAAAQPGAVTFSGDGRQLFVHDRTNMEVNAFDVQTRAKLASYPASGSHISALAAFHPNGYRMLVVPTGDVYDLEGGSATSMAILPVATYSYTLKASPDQRMVLGHAGSLMSVHRSALEGGKIVTGLLQGAGTAGGRDGEACFSASGDRIYTASGAPYDFPATSLATHEVIQRLPGGAYPNAIQSSWNGMVVGGIDGYYDDTDIWVYDGPSGANLAKLSSNGQSGGYRSLLDRGLALSGDGLRVVSLWKASYSGTSGGTLIQDLPTR